MPYQKRRRQNKRTYGAHSKYSGYLDTAGRALAVAYAVKKLINVEYRSITTDFTAAPSSSGAVVNLTAIAQGDDIANRQGSKIRAKYLSVKGHAKINTSASSTRLRMMIVRDNNGSTTQPAITDLFDDVGTFTVFKNKKGDPQSNSRFFVLWDKRLNFDATFHEQATIDYTMSLDHHIFYSGTAATDEGKGNIYLFIGSNEATNDPVVAIDAMVKFIDN